MKNINKYKGTLSKNLDPKTKGFIKGILIGALVLMLGAFGMEISGNDFDIQKLLNGQGLQGSKVEQAKDGTWLYGTCSKEKYDCADFKTQPQAQQIYNNCGGDQDVNGLDRDKDGIACENLPQDK
jgi:hypothetical protein